MIEWKNIRETGYKVSNDGDIMKPNGEVIKFRSKTYRKCDVGFVHRIVAYYFCNPPSEANDKFVCEGYEVHHKDLDPSNNKAENLVYLTYQEHKEAHKVKKPKANVEDKIDNNLIMIYLDSLR